MRKRFFICLLLNVPLILFFVVREKGVWRPRLMAKNDWIIQIAGSSQFSSTRPYHPPVLSAVHTYYVLNDDGKVKKLKPTFTNDSPTTGCFLSDSQLAVLLPHRGEITGEIFDLHNSCSLCKLEPVKICDALINEFFEAYNVTVTPRGLYLVGPKFFEWNIKTGRLQKNWSCH